MDSPGGRLSVVDLFAGMKGWSRPFADRGHSTFTVEIEGRFDPDACMDIMDLTPDMLRGLEPDIILASPPCDTFSTMTMGKNWNKDGTPKTEKAALHQRLVVHTRWLCEKVGVPFIIENPRARLRTLGLMDGLERRTVWYCRLGEPTAKPTDLWGEFPKGLVLPSECHNGNPDHIASPRGSNTGTQGTGRYAAERRGSLTQSKARLRALYGTSDALTVKAARAKVPYALGLTVCLALEQG